MKELESELSRALPLPRRCKSLSWVATGLLSFGAPWRARGFASANFFARNKGAGEERQTARWVFGAGIPLFLFAGVLGTSDSEGARCSMFAEFDVSCTRSPMIKLSDSEVLDICQTCGFGYDCSCRNTFRKVVIPHA